MILLDTNILSEAMRPLPNQWVISWLDQQLVSDLFISAVTKAEIELGIALLLDGRKKQTLCAAASALFSKFAHRCLPFGATEATIYAEILSTARTKGKIISVEDGLIASTALSHKFYLATRNVKDFEIIPNLPLINPFNITEYR
jgi:toxin FitB